MKVNITLQIIFLSLFSLGCQEAPTTSDSTNQEPTSPEGLSTFLDVSKIAFVNANVIAMKVDNEIQEGMTVLVRDGVIEAIEPANDIDIPNDYLKVDASGKYLLPGLADMHTHASLEKDFFLYLANGVTTVRHMWGSSTILDLKKSFEEGTLLGPKIYSASAGFEEPPSYWPGTNLLNSVQEVDDLVKAQKSAGYDFIKVYENLSEEMYDALLTAAHRHGIKAIGHVSPRVGLEKALSSKQASIAHIAGYLEYAAKDGSGLGNPSNYEMDIAKLREIISKTVQANVWNCPTLTITTRNASQKAQLETNPNLKYVSPNMRSWFNAPGSGLTSWDSEAYMVHKRIVIDELNKAGAKMILGVDTGLRYLLPGFTVHEELENFVQAGLSPYEALKTATINPAEFLENETEYGTISEGKKANFILLDAKPNSGYNQYAKVSRCYDGT